MPIQTNCADLGFKYIHYTQADAQLMADKVISDKLTRALVANNEKHTENC